MAETSMEPKDESVLTEANNLLIQGRRFMALEDYQSATDALEQAVQLYDAYYGVAKIQCADAYMEYGLALVSLANLEAGSGTDKLMRKAGIEGEDEEEGDVDDEVDDDEEGVEGVDADKALENGQEAMDDSGEVKDDEMKPKENGNSESGAMNGTKHEIDDLSSETKKVNGIDGEAPAANSSEGPTPGTSSGQTAEEGDGDDVENEEATTIEIAWEVLCLAKRLFMTDESMDSRLKLAETLQKLGEISIEWDNNDNAVSILEECLNIRKAILQPEDRLIALTYYNLGLAHSFKSDILNANENFQNAINVIEKRIETLNSDLAKAKSGQDTIAVSTYEREINELKELLPDINMRMDDSKLEDVSNSSDAMKRTRDEIQQEDDEVKKVCLDKTKPVDDISHLVKRKTN